MAYKISDDCIKCFSCQDGCPVECISDDGDKLAINADECIECGQCAEACPVGAAVKDE